ncbi:MAG: NAD(P)H-dependent oxidoreductase [Acidimicrobiia bacterium]|nr:NAD(P)H-dependent oxidoreductase [Acidimicrobiia bacterium]
MSNLNIPVILGTARPGRRSESVAELVIDTLKQRGVTTELIDVADYELNGTGLPAQGLSRDHYREIITGADGFVIVAPEYNHGYPGELKLLLDGEYNGYVRKPVGFVSVSTGLIGGARMTEQLRLVATALRMVPVSPAVHVTEVAEALDANGGFAEDSPAEVLAAMLGEVEWFASALTPARTAAS